MKSEVKVKVKVGARLNRFRFALGRESGEGGKMIFLGYADLSV